MWIGGFDPSAGAPGEGIFAPVARVGVQSHQVRDHEGILGDVDVATVGLEHLRLIARVLGYSGQGVVQAKSLQLFDALSVNQGNGTKNKYHDGNGKETDQDRQGSFQFGENLVVFPGLAVIRQEVVVQFFGNPVLHARMGNHE